MRVAQTENSDVNRDSECKRLELYLLSSDVKVADREFKGTNLIGEYANLKTCHLKSRSKDEPISLLSPVTPSNPTASPLPETPTPKTPTRLQCQSGNVRSPTTIEEGNHQPSRTSESGSRLPDNSIPTRETVPQNSAPTNTPPHRQPFSVNVTLSEDLVTVVISDI